MRDAHKQGRHSKVELLNYHKDGSPYWVAISINPIVDEKSQPRAFLAIERRITDRPIPLAA